jgi:succinate dehydrogenase/fumarate reductase flavoprotein subunit
MRWAVDSMDTDVLVLGGGVAGHRAAVAASEGGARVALAYQGRGASPFIIAANVPLGHGAPQDSPAVYFEDMVRGGYGLNDRPLVRVIVAETTEALRELEALGVPLAREGERYLQRHLSGNTYPRSIYTPKGLGLAILERLGARCQALGVDVMPGWHALALMRDGREVAGALLLKRNRGRLLAIRARAVVLAMGGIGRLYDDSTYPADVGADSYAMAWEAEATLLDMEFVQFEPLVTVHPQGARGMEMPTAMLGDGAHLLNAEGERFMFRYNPEHGERRIEKARLSLCIQREIDEGRGLPDASVALDTTAVPTAQLESYVSHCRRLRAAGMDPALEMPHVRPAAHSQMGGVQIDEHGWCGVPGLYCGGEAAGGVHGASRLAGNGGSDTLVFGALAGRHAARGLLSPASRDWGRLEAQALEPLRAAQGEPGPCGAEEIKSAVRRLMIRGVGLYRSARGLGEALAELERLQRDAGAGLLGADLQEASRVLEARHMVLIARMIAAAALARTESRGAHQRLDFPRQDDAHWLKHIAFRRAGADGFTMAELPIG